MAFDIGGFAKEHRNLLLSLGGFILLTIMMASSSVWQVNLAPSSGGGTSTQRPYPSTNTNTNISVTPINNGKNNSYISSPVSSLAADRDYKATIITDQGNFTVDLYEDTAPQNVNNFVFLAEDGFYIGTSFHRVVDGYLIQGGDPLGTGLGGPGYFIDDEVSSVDKFAPYFVAMANAGADSNGSQFFITSKSFNTTELDGKYTIIGRIISGFAVVDTIEGVEVNTDYQPLESIRIQDITIK